MALTSIKECSMIFKFGEDIFFWNTSSKKWFKFGKKMLGGYVTRGKGEK